MTKDDVVWDLSDWGIMGGRMAATLATGILRISDQI